MKYVKMVVFFIIADISRIVSCRSYNKQRNLVETLKKFATFKMENIVKPLRISIWYILF